MGGGPTAGRLVLGIAGSPRRGGNSAALLEACLEGARGVGVRTRELVVADLQIGPCTSCGECSSTGECVIDDDMTEVYPLLDEAAAIAVASPVFFATVPAQLKALYDRCQPYWARRYVLGRPGLEVRRPGILLLTRGGGDPFGHECAVATTKSVFAVLDVVLEHEIVIDGVDAAGDLLSRPEAVEWAREKGAWLASR